jgi:hypothetical protein
MTSLQDTGRLPDGILDYQVVMFFHELLRGLNELLVYTLDKTLAVIEETNSASSAASPMAAQRSASSSSSQVLLSRE